MEVPAFRFVTFVRFVVAQWGKPAACHEVAPINSPQTPFIAQKRELIAVVRPVPRDTSDCQTKSCGDGCSNGKGYFFHTVANSCENNSKSLADKGLRLENGSNWREVVGNNSTVTTGRDGESVINAESSAVNL